MNELIELRTKPRAFQKGETIRFNDTLYEVISINEEHRSFDSYTLKLLSN